MNWVASNEPTSWQIVIKEKKVVLQTLCNQVAEYFTIGCCGCKKKIIVSVGNWVARWKRKPFALLG